MLPDYKGYLDRETKDIIKLAKEKCKLYRLTRRKALKLAKLKKRRYEKQEFAELEFMKADILHGLLSNI